MDNLNLPPQSDVTPEYIVVSRKIGSEVLGLPIKNPDFKQPETDANVDLTFIE